VLVGVVVIVIVRVAVLALADGVTIGMAHTHFGDPWRTLTVSKGTGGVWRAS
jgi:hypothetical protein